MRQTWVLLCAVGFTAFSAHAALSEDVLTHPEPEMILEIAKGFGAATLDEDGSGDPMVAGRMQGMKYMERLLRLPFGTDADPAATAAQIAELFDDNAVIELTALIAFQNMSSKFNAALDVAPQGFCRLPQK